MIADEFARDGFLVSRNMVSVERCAKLLAKTKQHWEGHIHPLEYEADFGNPGAPASKSVVGGKTIRRLRDAYARDAVFQDWARDENLLDKLSQVLNDDPVLCRAQHNSILTKSPTYGTATDWHRDTRYWSYHDPNIISVWLALGHESKGNGALSVVPGSHRDVPKALETAGPGGDTFARYSLQIELEQGDVLFFHSHLLHAAGKNLTDETKFSLVFAYRGARNQPLPSTRSAAISEIFLR